MPDITAELYSIKTKSLGDNVLGAIYDALLKIDNYIGPVELDEEVERTATLLNLTDTLGWLADQESYNITEELEIIKNSRYGSEIRMAIHDAIDKLNKAASARPAPPEPSKVGAVMGEVGWIIAGANGGVSGDVVGEHVTPDLPYIQSNGTQGIRCDFTPSSTNVKYQLKYADIEMSNDTSWHQVYGGFYNGMRPGGFGFCRSNYGGNMVICIGGGDSFTSTAFPKSGYHELTVEISGYNLTVTLDDYTFTTTYSGSIACPVGLCCGANASGTMEMSAVKVYGFKIWENSQLKRDFSPALVANRAGFLDSVSNTMFYSSTGTDFTYVPAAEAEG